MLLFAAALAVIASLVSGLVPAVVTTRTDAALAIRRHAGPMLAGRGAGRLRSAIIISEIAASIVLLVGAALLAEVSPG